MIETLTTLKLSIVVLQANCLLKLTEKTCVRTAPPYKSNRYKFNRIEYNGSLLNPSKYFCEGSQWTLLLKMIVLTNRLERRNPLANAHVIPRHVIIAFLCPLMFVHYA